MPLYCRQRGYQKRCTAILLLWCFLVGFILAAPRRNNNEDHGSFFFPLVSAEEEEQKARTLQQEGEQQQEQGGRAARPMTLEFFRTLIYTAVGARGEDEDTSRTTETDWQEHTESNWLRAVNLATTENRKFPFIVCDDGQDDSSAERKRDVARQAAGIETTGGEEEDDDLLSRYFVAIYNTAEISCYLGAMNGTRAQGLGEFVVQPLSFLMKINSGTIPFTGTNTEEATTAENGAASDALWEYAVYFCPGNDNVNQTWALGELRNLVPLIPRLVEVPEAAIYREYLERLQGVLEEDPNFCDQLLIDNVEADYAGEDFVILGFNTTHARSGAGGAGAATCFLLFSFAMAYAPEVCYIERRVPFRTSNKVAQWIGQSGLPGETPFYDVGITGEGQIVAVSDTGLDLDNCYFRDDEPMTYGKDFADTSRRKVVQYYDFVNRGEVVNGHGTHVCGTIAGRKSQDGVTNEDGFVDGVAKDAKIAFVDIGTDDENGALKVPSAFTLLNPGHEAGAMLHSASWGSTATYYSNMDRDFDRYIYHDERFLVLVAAGNDGPGDRTVGSPANAKNVLSIGASNSADNDVSSGTTPVDELASFSSTGPSQDRRIKPDIVAPGAYVLSAGSRNQPSCDPPSERDLPSPGRSTNAKYGILSLQGTSMATPVTSGHAALVRQYFLEGWHGDGTKGSADSMDPTGTLVKAVLINGAQPLAGYAMNQVDSKQGFGRLSLIDSLPLAGKNDLTGGFWEDSIRQGKSKTNDYNFVVDSNKTCDDAEISITLVWADPEGYIGCLNCVLNDLDLKLVQTTSDGTRTEHFPNGGTAKDSVNNVERCRVKASNGDSFEVTVTAARLEGRRQTYAVAVVYGCLNHRVRAGEAPPTPTMPTQTASSSSRAGAFLAWRVFFLAAVSFARMHFFH